MTAFTRRVSFNNLLVSELAPAAPQITQKDLMDSDFGYGGAVHSDISDIYGPKDQINDIIRSIKQQQQAHQQQNKILHDPNATPLKPILKNKEYTGLHLDESEFALKLEDDLDDDLNDTLSPELSPTVSRDVPSALPSTADSPFKTNYSLSKLPPSGNSLGVPSLLQTPRRKLYLEMTNDELLAMDPQFTRRPSQTGDLAGMKFNNTTTFYRSSSRNSSGSSNAAAKAAAAAAAKKGAYPTSNENNYKSICLTVKHEEYQSPETFRTILSVISGRRHTWNSLDWLFNDEDFDEENSLAPTNHPSQFLQDGDYLVVTALLPNMNEEYDFYYNKCESLLQYLIRLSISHGLKLKITVEFVLSLTEQITKNRVSNSISGTKYMLYHITNQYLPSLIVIGNKSTNLNFKYMKNVSNNIFLIKLASYVLKYSIVPVIFVGNVTRFHRPVVPRSNGVKSNGLKLTVSNKGSTFTKPALVITSSHTPSPPPLPQKERKNSAASIDSDDSQNSSDMEEDDNDSLASFKGESSNPKPLVESDEDECMKEVSAILADDRFQYASRLVLAIDTISEFSYNSCNAYLSGKKTDPKIDEMYLAQKGNNGGRQIYKVKSLFGTEEATPTTTHSHGNSLKHTSNSSSSASMLAGTGRRGSSSNSSSVPQASIPGSAPVTTAALLQKVRSASVKAEPAGSTPGSSSTSSSTKDTKKEKKLGFWKKLTKKK